jgi:hypothetical protein
MFVILKVVVCSFLEFLGLVALAGVVFDRRFLLRILMIPIALSLLSLGTYGLIRVWNDIPAFSLPPHD